jgi:hypothetical protein
MAEESSSANAWDRDVARVAEELAGRLRSRGIVVTESDTPDDIERLVEAIEAFESEVEAGGGDLMVDEPPARGNAQPDNEQFLLPRRAADESASQYLRRLDSAIAEIRAKPR